MKDHAVVIAGSGINSLVRAAELPRRGRRVLVLWRESGASGCIRTAEGDGAMTGHIGLRVWFRLLSCSTVIEKRLRRRLSPLDG